MGGVVPIVPLVKAWRVNASAHRGRASSRHVASRFGSVSKMPTPIGVSELLANLPSLGPAFGYLGICETATWENLLTVRGQHINPKARRCSNYSHCYKWARSCQLSHDHGDILTCEILNCLHFGKLLNNKFLLDLANPRKRVTCLPEAI